jgi:hypothetical protein
MRLRLVAIYLGVPYQAGLGPDGNQVTLFSLGPPPEELGFEAGSGHWRKRVSVADLDALWQSRPVGDYRGEPCLVLDDLGDRLHIAYLGRDAMRAAQLGYWEIDREVFEVVVGRLDVTGLVEERVDFPLAAATFPLSLPEAGGVAVNGGGSIAAEYAGETAGYAAGAPENGSGATENGQPEGYGGADHTGRMLDRVAAWHGSPAPESWPAPAGQDGHGEAARNGSDLRPQIWAVSIIGLAVPLGKNSSGSWCRHAARVRQSVAFIDPSFTCRARRQRRTTRAPARIFHGRDGRRGTR